MDKCAVRIEVPIKNVLNFEFECDVPNMRFSICDSSGFIKLSGPLKLGTPHRINISELKIGIYNLKIQDGDVWGDNKFEIC